MAPLLTELDCGWFDGACHTCAKGIYLYLLASGTLDPAAVSFRVISDHHHWANHVVVSISTHSRTWYLDANGISSSRRLLRYWEQEEHLLEAWISDYWNAQEAEEAIPSLGGIALILAEKMLTTFGPFSPAWLEADATPASMTDRGEEQGTTYYVYEQKATGQRTGRQAGPFSKCQADIIALTLASMPTSMSYRYSVIPHEA